MWSRHAGNLAITSDRDFIGEDDLDTVGARYGQEEGPVPRRRAPVPVKKNFSFPEPAHLRPVGFFPLCRQVLSKYADFRMRDLQTYASRRICTCVDLRTSADLSLRMISAPQLRKTMDL